MPQFRVDTSFIVEARDEETASSAIRPVLLNKRAEFGPELIGGWISRALPTYEVLSEPLSVEEMRQQMEEIQIVHGVIPMDLGDLIGDFEAFCDTMSLKLTGTDLLCDILYTIVDCDEGTVFLKVQGDATEILDLEPEEETE